MHQALYSLGLGSHEDWNETEQQTKMTLGWELKKQSIKMGSIDSEH